MRSFVTWCGRRWPIPARCSLRYRTPGERTDNTGAIAYAGLNELLRRREVPVREKTLWRMLYETAAQASEVLALDVENLDLARRRARTRSKGGSTDMIDWAVPTS